MYINKDSQRKEEIPSYCSNLFTESNVRGNQVPRDLRQRGQETIVLLAMYYLVPWRRCVSTTKSGKHEPQCLMVRSRFGGAFLAQQAHNTTGTSLPAQRETTPGNQTVVLFFSISREQFILSFHQLQFCCPNYTINTAHF